MKGSYRLFQSEDGRINIEFDNNKRTVLQYFQIKNLNLDNEKVFKKIPNFDHLKFLQVYLF